MIVATGLNSHEISQPGFRTVERRETVEETKQYREIGGRYNAIVTRQRALQPADKITEPPATSSKDTGEI